ncbi:hypothetical protein CP532_2025 [Ophiocordyceps camponoti-leonardi (nom. inval.)]|nr:hypothetical protein CP532_2025 [Ophiocordyceps camponoti-leonardi (nom. inval.)]
MSSVSSCGCPSFCSYSSPEPDPSPFDFEPDPSPEPPSPPAPPPPSPSFYTTLPDLRPDRMEYQVAESLRAAPCHLELEGEEDDGVFYASSAGWNHPPSITVADYDSYLDNNMDFLPQEVSSEDEPQGEEQPEEDAFDPPRQETPPESRFPQERPLQQADSSRAGHRHRGPKRYCRGSRESLYRQDGTLLSTEEFFYINESMGDCDAYTRCKTSSAGTRGDDAF